MAATRSSLAGIGKLTTDLGDGSRLFAEGGGGLDVGPIGVELGVKFAWNKLVGSGGTPLPDHSDHDSRHADVLIMTVESWLSSAIADAERRGLPELKPLLETLARSTEALRRAAAVVSASEPGPHPEEKPE